MKVTEAMIAWNPYTDQIEVGPWQDSTGWSDRYRMTSGACEMALHKMKPEMQIAMLFIHFHAAVVRDRVPVDAAHRAFLVVDEYRRRISPDIPGAEE